MGKPNQKWTLHWTNIISHFLGTWSCIPHNTNTAYIDLCTSLRRGCGLIRRNWFAMETTALTRPIYSHSFHHDLLSTWDIIVCSLLYKYLACDLLVSCLLQGYDRVLEFLFLRWRTNLWCSFLQNVFFLKKEESKWRICHLWKTLNSVLNNILLIACLSHNYNKLYVAFSRS